MTHKKRITKLIAGVLSVVMVFGVLMFVSPTEAQAISLNATDTGFYNLAYGANGATTFGAEAQIRVINKTRADKGKSKSDAIYGYDGMTWSAVDTNNYIVWDGTDENTFYGVYPYNAEYNSFTIPTDQSGGVQDADWMTANYTAAKDEGNVNLNFHHCLAKVTVNITKWNSEFDGSEKVIEDPKIYTKGTAVEVTYATDGPNVTTSDGALTPITPSADGHTYTAIVAPAAYASTDKFMTFTVDGQAMTVLATTPKQTNGLNAGLHYTFNLTVGKDGVTLSSVTVSDWANGGTIDGSVATEVAKLNVVDATAMTADELNVAVATALAAGYTDIEVTLAANSGQEMFSAIWTAFSESTAADGSINMTISGAKTVPEYGFFDYDDYSDNDDKNIAGDKLKSLTLTDVETIGEYAFSACTYLESVNLPQVVTIGECAFNEWKKGTKLTSLNLPNATTIGDWAFAYSSLLTSVNLPKVTSIGMLAFGYCDLRTLNLPEVTTIDGEAFLNNYNLVSCSAPKATTIDYYPWGNCSRLETLELTAAGGFTLGNNLFANTPTGQINLMLNKDKESQVTQNADGTATWATTNQYGGSLTYTFKSITFIGE